MPASRATCEHRPHSIYFLRCPDTMRVVYIGTTANCRARLSNHISFAKSYGRNHTGVGITAWMYALVKQGKRPLMQVVFTGLSLDCAYRVERQLIERHALHGNLLQQTHYTSKAFKLLTGAPSC